MLLARRPPRNLGIEWNAENQLKKVLKNAVTIATFAYDPFGRRVEKVAGGTTTTRAYDRADILREIAGASTTYYVHMPRIDEPLAKEISGSSTCYHADALGSVLKMSNGTGGVTHDYRYDAYGRIEAAQRKAGFPSPEGNGIQNPAGSTTELGTSIPQWGRFISQDPLGFAGGLNHYPYVENKPPSVSGSFWAKAATLGKYSGSSRPSHDAWRRVQITVRGGC